MVKGYSTKGSMPRCMLQMDLQKAYDAVEWSALESILKELSFLKKFIKWVMLTFTTVSYKFRINGDHSRFMVAKRGLRQGGHFPLLFVIIMEYLHRVLQKLKHIPNFNFHSKCEKLSIINLSFADDLLMFARGDIKSISLVMEAFEGFSKSNGLSVNPNK